MITATRPYQRLIVSMLICAELMLAWPLHALGSGPSIEEMSVDVDVSSFICALALTPGQVEEQVALRMERDLPHRRLLTRLWLRTQRQHITRAVMQICEQKPEDCNLKTVRKLIIIEMRARRNVWERIEDRTRSVVTMGLFMSSIIGAVHLSHYLRGEYPTYVDDYSDYMKIVFGGAVIAVGTPILRRITGNIGKATSRVRSGDLMPEHGLPSDFVEDGTDQMIGDWSNEQHRFVGSFFTAVRAIDGAAREAHAMLAKGDRELAVHQFALNVILTSRFFSYVPARSEEFLLTVDTWLNDTNTFQSETERQSFVDAVLARIAEKDIRVKRRPPLLDYYRRVLHYWFDLEEP